MDTTRRKFVLNAGKFSVGLGVITLNPSLVKAMKRGVPANEKINIALIGARGRGFHILKQALMQPETVCVAVCDIDDSVMEGRMKEIATLQDAKPGMYKDFRALLENKDVDAVIIGTPDHWHCLQMVNACEAGKDVYVEKPMANSLGELDIMVNAARKYNRVVQVGQQQRSGKHWMEVMDHIKSGKIGQLRKVHMWANFKYGVGGKVEADSKVPEGVDFDMWLGPAPARSYNKARFHGSWRMFWDYGGGLMTDWGVHLIDMGLWAKNIKATPKAVVSTGGNYSHQDHAHETYDSLSVSWQMDDFVFSWESLGGIQTGPYGKTYGLAFVGNDATIVADREGWSLTSEMDQKQAKTTAASGHSSRTSSDDHMRNFLDCIKSRNDPNCSVENGRLVAQYAHMANIAQRTRSRLVWDPDRGKFMKNKKANALISPEYRKPWTLPKL